MIGQSGRVRSTCCVGAFFNGGMISHAVPSQVPLPSKCRITAFSSVTHNLLHFSPAPLAPQDPILLSREVRVTEIDQAHGQSRWLHQRAMQRQLAVNDQRPYTASTANGALQAKALVCTREIRQCIPRACRESVPAWVLHPRPAPSLRGVPKSVTSPQSSSCDSSVSNTKTDGPLTIVDHPCSRLVRCALRIDTPPMRIECKQFVICRTMLMD
jgi:hypothetical protein